MITPSRTYYLSALNLIFVSTFSFSLTSCSPSLHSEPQSEHISKPSFIKAHSLFHTIFQKYQLCSDIDFQSVASTLKTESVFGHEKFIEKISFFIEKNEPIRIHMIGFPFKSTNLMKKVDGKTPDRTERYALEYIHGFIQKVKAVYAPGVQFVIISDGFAFNDLFGISNDTLEDYENKLKILAQDLDGIEIVTSKDFMTSQRSSLNALREAISQDFSKYLQSLEQQIDQNSSVRNDFDVTKKRLAFELNHEEGPQILHILSNDNSIGSLAKNLMVRSKQFGTFIKTRYKNIPHLHFSVHFQKDISQKFGMKLSPESNITPWHGVLCKKRFSYHICHKEDLNPNLYTRAFKNINGLWCSYYKHKSTS